MPLYGFVIKPRAENLFCNMNATEKISEKKQTRRNRDYGAIRSLKKLLLISETREKQSRS
jgi:hypothetical protein